MKKSRLNLLPIANPRSLFAKILREEFVQICLKEDIKMGPKEISKITGIPKSTVFDTDAYQCVKQIKKIARHYGVGISIE
jgi:hypothetical protein